MSSSSFSVFPEIWLSRRETHEYSLSPWANTNFRNRSKDRPERTKGERKGAREERERERGGSLPGERDMDFNVATSISLFRPVAALARGYTISCSSESQDYPGIHEERRCFENRDTLPCSAIVITAIRNDLMAATNCITRTREFPIRKGYYE